MAILTGLIPQPQDAEGRTLPNCKLYTYAVGSYTPKVTYQNEGLSIPNANPVVADGDGRFFNIYLGSGGYRLVLVDQYGVQVWDQDNYYAPLDGGDLATINAQIALTKSYIPAVISQYQDFGTADHYLLSATAGGTPLPTAYTDGMIIGFTPQNANTGASTVNVAGLGVKNLLLWGGGPLTAGYMDTSKAYQFVYIGGQFYNYFHTGQLQASDIPNGLITGAMIANTTVTNANMANNTLTVGKLANGTATKLVGYDSGGSPTETSNPLLLLQSTAVTATASITFILSTLDGNQDTRNSYLLRFIGVQPATDDKNIYITLSTDAGSTWVATNYAWTNSHIIAGVAGSVTYGATGASQIEYGGATGAADALGNNTNETLNADVILTNVNTGTNVFPSLNVGSASYWDANATSRLVSFRGTGSNSSANDYDAIKISVESGGNFAAVGRIMLFKICNTV